MSRSPAEVQERLVHADRLQSVGDPRGELIVLQHTRHESRGTEQLEAAARAEMTHLLAHKEALLGDIDESRVALTWELGYIREAYFNGEASRSDVEGLLASESSRHVRRLGLGCEASDWHAIETLLAEAKRPLDGLYLWGDPPPSFASRAAPKIRRLWLRARRPPALSQVASRLEVLRLDLRSELALELPTHWPALRVLHIEWRSGEVERLPALESFLNSAELPSLEHLGIERTGGFTSALVDIVASSPALAGLEVLNLSNGDMTLAAAERLAEAIRTRGPNLKIVNLASNRLETMSRPLGETGVDVHYGVQETSRGRTSNVWGRNVRNREPYERADGNHTNTMGVQDSIRKAARKQGAEAAIAIFDSVPLLSPYRQGQTGAELTEKALKLLARGDQYESVLRLCRETPHSARTDILLRYELLAHLVADRFAEAAEAGKRRKRDDEVVLSLWLWARARLGDLDAAAELVELAHGEDSRWTKVAAAAALGTDSSAAPLLAEALDDVMPIIPPLPCAAAMARLFRHSQDALQVLAR